LTNRYKDFAATHLLFFRYFFLQRWRNYVAK